MFKTIFRKQFCLYMGTLVISFVVFGFSLSQALNGYFVSQKRETLKEQGERISSYVETYQRASNQDEGILSLFALQDLKYQVQVLHNYIDASFIYIDATYIAQIATSDVGDCLGKSLEREGLKPVMQGTVTTMESGLTDIFHKPVLTVAYPVIVNHEVIGAMLLSSSISELQKTISEAIKLILICLSLSGLFAFVLVYLSSRTITRPLREMNEAAKEIAGGDFEKRISVETKDEVGQLGESFNYMAESLYQQEKLRREFISNVSHDIRSPLTSMRGFLQAIMDGTVPPEKTPHYLNIVLDETERLTKLANDILDLNKIQSLEIALCRSNFDLNELLRKTIFMFEARCRNKNIALNLKLSDEINIVNADYEKVQRVIYNLIDNAVKFTQPEGQITIETTLAENKMQISVKDTGPGISQEDQKRIFERFFKGDVSRGADKMGSGLGLAIVRAFVKAHDETITLVSEEGKGCEFIFGLPLAEKESKPADEL